MTQLRHGLIWISIFTLIAMFSGMAAMVDKWIVFTLFLVAMSSGATAWLLEKDDINNSGWENPFHNK